MLDAPAPSNEYVTYCPYTDHAASEQAVDHKALKAVAVYFAWPCDDVTISGTSTTNRTIYAKTEPSEAQETRSGSGNLRASCNDINVHRGQRLSRRDME
jgi:hypothetical protein